MAKRRLFQLQMFMVIAALILLKPVLVIARTEQPIDCETTVKQLNQISHLRRNDIEPKIRTRTRRLMNVVEIDDYPGSGANSRHTRPYCPDC